ncbi:hypothetical protein V5S96_04265 [Corynebacterium mastitidis]|uniref:CopG family transcriptional regulator n=1 Tax=Corynebacterium mastitidis TaxID=161890 RepID=A0ABU8NXH6_9CORY
MSAFTQDELEAMAEEYSGGIPESTLNRLDFRPGPYAWCLEYVEEQEFLDIAAYARRENLSFGEVLHRAVTRLLAQQSA